MLNIRYTFFRNTANSPVLLSPWLLNCIHSETYVKCFFDLRKNRYIFLEVEIQMLSQLSYPSSPISGPVITVEKAYATSWYMGINNASL